MKILLYSYNYHPEPIGIAPLMTELAEGLAKRGHQVRVVTAVPWYPANQISPEYRGKLYYRENRNDVKIQRSFVWINGQRSLKNRILFELSFVLLSFFQALRGPRPDLIFLTVPGLPVAVPAALIGAIYRVPIILNLQDILPDAAVQVGLLKNELVIRIFSRLEAFAYRTATKISVISEGFTKNLLTKGVSSKKIVEISNWVDINFIKPLPKQDSYFVKENDLEDKFVVLYSGNIALTQPLETLIDAAALLKDIPDLVVVIVGKDDAISRLEKYRQKRGADKVRLLPFQPREKLPEMLAAADVSMVLQKHNIISINMPSKIQVLLASGRPIIASVPSNGTAASVIQASGGGLVVDPENPKLLAEAIRELYSNPGRMKELGAKGRRYAEENYSFETALDRYERLFSEVLLDS